MTVLEEINSGSLKVILGSKSPRRAELLSYLIKDFEIRTRDCEEIYPENLAGGAIAIYLSQLKAAAFAEQESNVLLLTSDTIVWMGDRIFEKPKSEAEAEAMLKQLSGNRHQVFTGVTLRRGRESHSFVSETSVEFGQFTEKSISEYIQKFQPLDKAGSYGIQDCLSEDGKQIGPLSMTIVEGSYTNVIGLPVEELRDWFSRPAFN